MLSGLSAFKGEFTLAGGTGLALQLGHRISEDFDFFTDRKFENDGVLKKISTISNSGKIVQLQNEPGTLTVLVNDVKLSFFSIGSGPAAPVVETPEINIYCVREIGVFKLSALLRAVFKDYVDLYFVLQHERLYDILTLAKAKYPDIDAAIYLKALVSVEDVDLSPIVFMKGYERSPHEVYSALRESVRRFLTERTE